MDAQTLAVLGMTQQQWDALAAAKAAPAPAPAPAAKVRTPIGQAAKPQAAQAAKLDSTAALMAEIERLKAENLTLAAKRAPKLSMAVSEKGGISVYGIRRFPITFYVDEWQTLLGLRDDLKTFAETHKAELDAKAKARE